MHDVLERMKADLILSGKAASTRYKYLWCCRRFLEHYDRPVESLGKEEIRDYLLHLVQEREASVSIQVQAQASLKFLFAVSLGRPEEMEGIPWPSKSKRRGRRPEVPTRAEVAALLDCAPGPYWRMLFTTVYLGGLRRGEVSELQVGDLNARAGLIHLRRGTKGGKPRDVLLAEPLLGLLRAYWGQMRPPLPWVFPSFSVTRGWRAQPANRGTLTACFRRTREFAGIRRKVTFHGLRHAHATHLLEDGVPLPVIQALLGHAHPNTTQGYVRLGTEHLRLATEAVAKLLTRLEEAKMT